MWSKAISMNCPPPSHSMWWVFFCCVRAFFWIDYRIIEFIGHLSFCQKRFLWWDFEEKWGMIFFSRFFVGYKKKEIYILQNKTKKKKTKKKEKKNSGNWDLISFPHCSSVVGFTDVCTHTFMLNCRLYNTWDSVHFFFLSQ